MVDLDNSAYEESLDSQSVPNKVSALTLIYVSFNVALSVVQLF